MKKNRVKLLVTLDVNTHIFIEEVMGIIQEAIEDTYQKKLISITLIEEELIEEN